MPNIMFLIKLHAIMFVFRNVHDGLTYSAHIWRGTPTHATFVSPK